jgi:hypothetical protein
LDFAIAAETSGGWEIDGQVWLDNPLITLPYWTLPAVDLFLRCKRAAGMMATPLPAPGSVGEQPAALMDAFDLLESWMVSDAQPA